MSFTANLTGHTVDVAKQDQVQSIIDAAAGDIEKLLDRDAGDVFGGSFSGSEGRSSTYPAPVETADETE